MVQSIRKIGNSNGVLIPKNMLLSCGISDQVDMQVMGDVIVIKSASQKLRENWNLAFGNAINFENGSELRILFSKKLKMTFIKLIGLGNDSQSF
jgi:antitoxin MazE